MPVYYDRAKNVFSCNFVRERLTKRYSIKQESIFLVEARESERELMRLATLEDLPATESSTSVHTVVESNNRPFLDLAVRNKIQERSTVTSLESLASSIDLREEVDKKLKRPRDNLITSVDKESQVKEQRTSFRGIFPAGDISKESSKKTRKSDSK